MNPTQTQHLRHAILFQLDAACPCSLPDKTLHHGLRLDGHGHSERDLRVQLAYLLDKKLIALETCPLATGLPRYVLTAAGRDYLESQHLTTDS